MSTLSGILTRAISDGVGVRAEVARERTPIILGAISPADREALETGLLLAEVERHPDWQLAKIIPVWGAQWEVVAVPRAYGKVEMRVSHGKTIHAALTALLAQLESTP